VIDLQIKYAYFHTRILFADISLSVFRLITAKIMALSDVSSGRGGEYS